MKKYFYILINVNLTILYFLPAIYFLINNKITEKHFNSIYGKYKVYTLDNKIENIRINDIKVLLKVDGKIENDYFINENLKVFINNIELINKKISFVPKEGAYLIIGNFDMDSYEEILFCNINDELHFILDFYSNLDKNLKWSINTLDENNYLFKYIYYRSGFLGGLSDIIPIFLSLIIAFIILFVHLLVLIIIKIMIIKKRSAKT